MAIQSILENDLYKFSMSHYYQVHYPNVWGTFTFHDRTIPAIRHQMLPRCGSF
jgi:nicotinic acid phosphoribosyltransferase